MKGAMYIENVSARYYNLGDPDSGPHNMGLKKCFQGKMKAL